MLADPLVEADLQLEEEFWMGSRNKELVLERRPRGQDIPRERRKKGLRTEPGEHGFLRGKKRKTSLPGDRGEARRAGLKTRWRGSDGQLGLC